MSIQGQLGAIGRGVRRFACRVADDVVAGSDYLQGTDNTLDGTVNDQVSGARTLGETFKALACNGLDDEPNLGSPDDFLGGDRPGQCPVVYNVTILAQGDFNGSDSTVERSGLVPGPIGQPFTSQSAAEGTSWGVVGANGPIVFQNSGGPISRWTNLGAVILSVVRQDGGLDDCGSYQPPTTVIPTPDPDNPSGPTIPVQIILNGPLATLNNNLLIPFVAIAPEFSLIGELNLSIGEVSFNFGPNSGEPGETIPETDDPINESPDDEPPDEDPDEKRRLIGAYTFFSNIPNGANITRIGGRDDPQRYFPDVGLLSFAMNIEGDKGWSESRRVTCRKQWHPVPTEGRAYDVRITDRFGVAIATTRYYEKVQSQNNTEE